MTCAGNNCNEKACNGFEDHKLVSQNKRSLSPLFISNSSILKLDSSFPIEKSNRVSRVLSIDSNSTITTTSKDEDHQVNYSLFFKPLLFFSLLVLAVSMEHVNIEFFYSYANQLAAEGSQASVFLYACLPLSQWISGYLLGFILDKIKGQKKSLIMLFCMQFMLNGICHFLLGFVPFSDSSSSSSSSSSSLSSLISSNDNSLLYSLNVTFWCLLRFTSSILSINGMIVFCISQILFIDPANDFISQDTANSIYFAAKTISPCLANAIIMLLPPDTLFIWPFRFVGLVCVVLGVISAIVLVFVEIVGRRKVPGDELQMEQCAEVSDTNSDVHNGSECDDSDSLKNCETLPSYKTETVAPPYPNSDVDQFSVMTQKSFYQHFRWYTFLALVFTCSFLTACFFMEINGNVRANLRFDNVRFSQYRITQTSTSVLVGCFILYLMKKCGSTLTTLGKLIIVTILSVIPTMIHPFIRNDEIMVILNSTICYSLLFCFHPLTTSLIVEWVRKFPEEQRGKLQGFTMSMNQLAGVVGFLLFRFFPRSSQVPVPDSPSSIFITFAIISVLYLAQLFCLWWIDRTRSSSNNNANSKCDDGNNDENQ